MTPEPRPADRAGIAAAVEALSRGRLVLHPTETVVSLSGDPRDERAVASARAIKGYSTPRPFLCLVPDADSARSLAAEWPPAAERLADAFWPGPLTLVVSASGAAPAAATGEGTIAIRPAADPVSSALLSAWGGPLFSTSANRRGEVAPVEVRAALVALASARGGEAIELALEPATSASGPASCAQPSTIGDVAVHPPRLVRAGAIAEESIRSVVRDLQTA
ncbi:MAG TPA: L-threonylcarbamoyladenylate synthase [Gemmatimonadota bacterium]|nr:L-threonylcarbamoyladenylate synthase [Gemmatimonadota bacterium]